MGAVEPTQQRTVAQLPVYPSVNNATTLLLSCMHSRYGTEVGHE